MSSDTIPNSARPDTTEQGTSDSSKFATQETEQTVTELKAAGLEVVDRVDEESWEAGQVEPSQDEDHQGS